MASESRYKLAGDVIVTIPMSPALHRRLQIKAIHENTTIKALITKLIEDNCPC